MHPLAAPGALWVLSRAGKVPRPPAGGRNLPQETNFLQKAGKGPTFLFPVSQRISPLRRRPGGFPIAPWTPSGPIPIYVGETEKGLTFLFPHHKGFRLCGGDQRAFRSPFGNLRPLAANGNLYKKLIPCRRQETGLPFFPRIAKAFASAEATRGLFDRPLDPFGFGVYPFAACSPLKTVVCLWKNFVIVLRYNT